MCRARTTLQYAAVQSRLNINGSISELFKHPAVKPVSIPELTGLSEDLGLNCTDEELRELKGSHCLYLNL